MSDKWKNNIFEHFNGKSHITTVANNTAFKTSFLLSNPSKLSIQNRVSERERESI